LHQQLQTTTIYVTHDQEEAMTLGDRIVVMKDGVIQQADTPLVTYNAPANRFVAGFIGMPPMNFFDGIIRLNEGQMVFEEARIAGKTGGSEASEPAGAKAANGLSELTVEANGLTIPVPAHVRGRLEGFVGQQVVLGIRPEHLHLKPTDSRESMAAIQVRVNVIEPLGNAMDVYASTGLHDNVVARVEAAEGLQIDAGIPLYADLRKIHFFAPGETGKNLSLTSEPSHALA